jgi:SAM-dependent methyltransferase
VTVAPLRGGSPSAGWSEVVLASPHASRTSVTLVTECGASLSVDVSRWHSPADVADHSVLTRCNGPVLDIGSGPGRIVRALAARATPALGIDSSKPVVDLAVVSGARCVLADVFNQVPSEGEWETALLLDGNIGIGGDPVRLLRRVADLVTSTGVLLVELEPMHRGAVSSRRVRVVHGSDRSAWFAWAVVSVDEMPAYASRSGWTVTETWCCSERWFARLVRAGETS